MKNTGITSSSEKRLVLATGRAHPAGAAYDAKVSAIAEQLARELGEPPAANPGDRLIAQRHELAPADEERLDAAVVALLAGDPESTMRAHRAAAGEPQPRP